MVANGGDNEGLFRAAAMSCGSVLPTGDIAVQQQYFDAVAAYVGCAGGEDKLECLRGVPAEDLVAAGAKLPSNFGYKVRATTRALLMVYARSQIQRLTGCRG